MQRSIYPSDITREQFEVIRSLLDSGQIRTKPRRVDQYDIFCALLYVLKSGCQWRMLPSDFPKWQLVHYYFTVWGTRKDKRYTSPLEKVLKKIGRHGTLERWKKALNEHGYR